MSELLMPPYPNGSVQQQLTQQYSYLFQMAQQLNMALSALEGGAVSTAGNSGQQRKSDGAAAAAGKAALENAEQFQNLRAMIVKTAKQVSRHMEQLETRLSEEYVASSQFGTYVQRLSAYLEANPEALTQYYSFCSDLAANVAAVDAAFSTYKLDTEGYIRTGIVYYDGPAPVYGVAVGQNLTTTEIDGQQVVEQNNFRAVFTAQRLSFWQDSTEIAYVSNNRLYITNITVLDSISIGHWRMDSGNGLAFKWIGG